MDFKEKFPHLSKAPIIEATIDIRAVLSASWDETALHKKLKTRLSDFSKIEAIRATRFQISFPKKQANQPLEDIGCVGFKLHSNNNLHIAQFNKEAFVFSRLKPYEDWEHFSQEALRLWAVYYELLKPTNIIRIGLRFINRISIRQEMIKLEEYYKYPPESLKNLDWSLTGYLHHDVMRVPETAYSVNLIKTIQNVPGEIGLILDIDVFNETQFACDQQQIIECLSEMRWIKNKIFFSSLTDKTLMELK
jgi:uncharacterized protein (TIGR04255 family)